MRSLWNKRRKRSSRRMSRNSRANMVYKIGQLRTKHIKGKKISTIQKLVTRIKIRVQRQRLWSRCCKSREIRWQPWTLRIHITRRWSNDNFRFPWRTPSFKNQRGRLEAQVSRVRWRTLGEKWVNRLESCRRSIEMTHSQTRRRSQKMILVMGFSVWLREGLSQRTWIWPQLLSETRPLSHSSHARSMISLGRKRFLSSNHHQQFDIKQPDLNLNRMVALSSRRAVSLIPLWTGQLTIQSLAHRLKSVRLCQACSLTARESSSHLLSMLNRNTISRSESYSKAWATSTPFISFRSNLERRLSPHLSISLSKERTSQNGEVFPS